MARSAAHLRALYRAFLRELPPRPVLSATRSSLRRQLRAAFAEAPVNGGGGSEEATQLLAYVRAQRRYVSLLEQYNPGVANEDGEERVRLTARRVGLNLPVAFRAGAAS